MSPTSSAVVAETLKMAKIIAQETNQEVITVTYDLAVAKMAYQIQSTEAPTYNNVFIQLGVFHIEMAYFKAVGKFIEESGCVDILVENELLAAGLVKGLITGKHFNR